MNAAASRRASDRRPSPPLNQRGSGPSCDAASAAADEFAAEQALLDFFLPDQGEGAAHLAGTPGNADGARRSHSSRTGDRIARNHSPPAVAGRAGLPRRTGPRPDGRGARSSTPE